MQAKKSVNFTGEFRRHARDAEDTRRERFPSRLVTAGVFSSFFCSLAIEGSQPKVKFYE